MNWSRVYTGRNRNWPGPVPVGFFNLVDESILFLYYILHVQTCEEDFIWKGKKYRQTISIPVYITFIIMLWPCFRTILIYSRYKWYIVRENNGEKRTNLINITEQRGWNGSHEQLAHFDINRNLSLISTMIKNNYKCL